MWYQKGEGNNALEKCLLPCSTSEVPQQNCLNLDLALQCIDTSLQVDLHALADPRMFLWNFSGIFTLSGFRPPVEKLSWVRMSLFVRRALGLVQIAQIFYLPLFSGLTENLSS